MHEVAMFTLRQASSFCLGLAAVCLFAASQTAAQALKEVRMTASDLSDYGIDIRMPGFPSKCYYDPKLVLSVSDPMLRHFEARGFSLHTLCLALQSDLRYDSETGKQLPIAVAARRTANGSWIATGPSLLLNVPDCF